MQNLFNRLFNSGKFLQRLVLSITLILFAIQLWATPANATGVYQFPSLTAGDKTWVFDKGEVLSRATEGSLSSTLDNLAEKTGNQVRIVTIRRLDYGETAESFTNKLFEKWFPTGEEQANQTLLVIDVLTNNTAIRTGEKVKTILPDSIAQSVAQETVLVPLREGDKYNQALSDASTRLVAVLSGQADPGAPEVKDNIQIERTFKTAEETDQGSATIWVIGLLIAATIIPMATYFLYQRAS